MDPDDMILWPNDDWCFGSEFELYHINKSDDFTIINFNSPKYQEICNILNIEEQNGI